MVHSWEQGLEGRQGGGWVAGSRGHVPKGLGLHHPWGEGAVRGGQSGISEMQGWGRDSLPSFKGIRTPVFPSPKGTPLGYLFVSLLSPMFVTSWMMPTWTAPTVPPTVTAPSCQVHTHLLSPFGTPGLLMPDLHPDGAGVWCGSKLCSVPPGQALDSGGGFH